jgi:hypothetical protein
MPKGASNAANKEMQTEGKDSHRIADFKAEGGGD